MRPFIFVFGFIIVVVAANVPHAQEAAGKSGLASATLLGTAFNPPSVQSFWYIGALDGLYRAHGIDLHPQQSPGSPASTAGIVSGKAQFASVNLTTFANAAAEGLPAKGIMLGNFDTPGVIITHGNISSLSQLAGKTLAATALGSQDYTILSSYLATNGVDLGKVNWAATGGSANAIQGLAAHRIDAAWFDMTMALKALDVDPTLKILVTPEELSKGAPIGTGLVVVTNTFAKAHADLIEAFVEASIESCRRLVQDEAYFPAIADKWIPGVYRPDQLDLLYKAYRTSYGVNGGLIISALDKSLGEWKRTINPGRASNPYFSSVEQIIDTQYAAAALKKLGVASDSRGKADWMK